LITLCSAAGEQLAAVADCINAAYHKGKADAVTETFFEKY
jgi:hypothetical protein